MKLTHLFLLALLVFAAVAQPIRAQDDDDEDEDEEEPFQGKERAILLTYRTLGSEFPIEGREMTVVVEVHNAGSGSAINVEIEDNEWPEEFALSGSLKASFDSIPAQTTVRHTYKVTPTAAGRLTQAPVRVSYQAMEELDAVRTVSSSAPFTVRVHTIAEDYRRRVLGAGSVLTLGMISTLRGWVMLAVFVVAALSARVGYKVYRSFAAKSRRRRRHAALADLQRMEKTR